MKHGLTARAAINMVTRHNRFDVEQQKRLQKQKQPKVSTRPTLPTIFEDEDSHDSPAVKPRRRLNSGAFEEEDEEVSMYWKMTGKVEVEEVAPESVTDEEDGRCNPIFKLNFEEEEETEPNQPLSLEMEGSTSSGYYSESASPEENDGVVYTQL
ncbi:hypothetical protein CAEBREN_15204 [Caenorhabditis brenneri]|uniref:Uncharacterized protein n=1 Tax=Caenorhabditis brenneri TaxID=135651 RepID=G0NTQ2_CAEBE|nr:hypothetical protein CAEBREN_15204 [Caenorhabditis brenneri]